METEILKIKSQNFEDKDGFRMYSIKQGHLTSETKKLKHVLSY